MDDANKKPIVLVFAGPNGSGKTTVTRGLPTFGTYINADDIKSAYNLTDLEAAQQAESLRNALLEKGVDFSFETVLSTERNLLLLEKAKALGYIPPIFSIHNPQQKKDESQIFFPNHQGEVSALIAHVTYSD
jgi:predicted ABC-type ATPase